MPESNIARHQPDDRFVDRATDAGPLPPSDDGRAIDYVAARISPDHVLASAAIPIAFPPIRIDGHGWYLDGGVRLNAPLKPAISLGADALEEGSAPPPSSPAPPAMDDVTVQFVDIVLVDRMVEDACTLRTVNDLLGSQNESSRDDKRPCRKITLGENAIEVYENQLRSGNGVLDFFRRHELRMVEWALFGDGPRRGDLLSYLYFDPAFI